MNVVFDFGIVLFSWQPEEVVAEVFHEFVTPERSAGQLRDALFGRHFDQPEWLAFDGGSIEPAACAQRMADRTQLPLELVVRLIDLVPERLLPNKPMLELMESLRADGHTLYFLSNMPVPYARILEARHTFVRAFTDGVFSGDVKLVKPNPAIFRTLFERTGIEPGQSVFIDDHLPNVEASRALGMAAVHYENASDTAAALAQIFENQAA